MSVTCPTCNAECDEHDRFCWSCGTELMTSSWEPVAPTDDMPTASARDGDFIPLVLPPLRRDGGADISGLRMGLLGAAAVLLLAVAGWAAMTRLGEEGDDVPEVVAPTGTEHAIAVSTPTRASINVASPSPAGVDSDLPSATTGSTPVASPAAPASPAASVIATPALQESSAVPTDATPLATAAPESVADEKLSARLANTVIDLAVPESLETAIGTPAVGDGTGGPDDLPE